MASRLILSRNVRQRSYGSRIKLLSPAKINLYLNITGNYGRGFHRLESIAERVSLCDEIAIELTDSSSVTISSNRKDLESQANLAVQAACLLKRKFKLPYGFAIRLNKRIPVAAGLGGGSSNAASTLIGINSLLGLRLKQDQLYRLGARLGSDVNFFLSQSAFAWLSGRGQIVRPFVGRPLRQLIIWPGIGLSTQKVYQRFSAKLTKFFSSANILKYALKKGDSALREAAMFNVLERTALALCPELTAIKKYFQKRGLLFRVSGSGSALYVIWQKSSFSDIKRSLPKRYSVFAVETF